MNANELRILNSLLLYGEVVKVTEIGFKNNDYYLRVEGNKNGYYLDQFEPIELTEEILLKCGFEKKWLLSNREGYYVLINNKKIRIKFVHSLQNLYYCLCGKELEIEL